MIPETEPVNNYYGNNEATQFDFNFYIEDETQLTVTHTDLDGVETTLEFEVDYTINEVGNENGSYITFPIQGSSYDVLAWDEDTDEKEILSLALDLPFTQEAEYTMSSTLNKETLEYSFDKLTRICQILRRQLERCVKVSEGDETTPDELLAELNETMEQLQAAAEEATEAANAAASEANTAASSAATSLEELITKSEEILTAAQEIIDSQLGDNYLGQVVRSNFPLTEETLTRADGTYLDTSDNYYTYLKNIKDNLDYTVTYREISQTISEQFGATTSSTLHWYNTYYTNAKVVEDTCYDLGYMIPKGADIFTWNINKFRDIGQKFFTAFNYALISSTGTAPDNILIAPASSTVTENDIEKAAFTTYTGESEFTPSSSDNFFSYDSDTVEEMTVTSVTTSSSRITIVNDDGTHIYNLTPANIKTVTYYNGGYYISNLAADGTNYDYVVNSSVFLTTKEYYELSGADTTKHYIPSTTVYSSYSDTLTYGRQSQLNTYLLDDCANIAHTTDYDIGDYFYFNGKTQSAACTVDENYMMSDITDGYTIYFGNDTDGTITYYDYSSSYGQLFSFVWESPSEFTKSTEIIDVIRALRLRVGDTNGTLYWYMSGYKSDSSLKWRYSITSGITLEPNCRYLFSVIHGVSYNYLAVVNLYTGDIQRYTTSNATYTLYNYYSKLGISSIYWSSGNAYAGGKIDLSTICCQSSPHMPRELELCTYEQGVYLPTYTQTDEDNGIYSYIITSNGLADGTALKSYTEEAQALIEEAQTAQSNAESYADLAKDWAIKTDGTVDGEEYSAKYYAQLAQTTVEIAQGGYVLEADFEDALAEKANTQDLAAVATSGSYTDLSDTPTKLSEFEDDVGYLTDIPDEYVTEDELNVEWESKQDVLTFDETPTEGSTNPVTSGGIYTALQDVVTFDETPTSGSSNAVTSDALYDLFESKQDVLTFDEVPTEDSANPVTSGGVYTALSNVSVDLSGYYTSTETDAAIAAAIEEAIGNVESGSY